VTPLVLVGARIWDGDGPGRLHAADALRIDGERIAALGRSGELCAGARVLRLDGGFLVPGLIDAHVHLCLDPALSTPAAQAAVPPEEREAALVARAVAMLRAGITTARDLGGAAWRELDLRERIEAGTQSGPRLLCAGQPVTTPGGHCWYWGGEAADAAAIERVIARQVERGVDWIKLMATGGRNTHGTQPHEPQFDAPLIAGAVRAAAARGRPVAAHCHGTAGIRNAAEAGVQSAEHCSFAGPGGFGTDFDPGVAARLAERGIWVSATVNAGWARYFDARGEPLPFARRMAAVYGGLRRAGVRLVASTDAGIPGVAHDGLARALPVFGRIAGLTPLELLRSATSGAADALGLAAVTGRLRPGLAADVLALRADPLADPAAAADVALVIARGRLLDGASATPS
jgi:imidazolonepropionase-like amidohydrolase